MTFEIAIAIAVTLTVVAVLGFSKYSPDTVMLAGVGVLLLTGVLSAEQALDGFANEGLATVALLLLVAEGLRETGASMIWVQRLLKNAKSVRGATTRISLSAGFFSAFLNNTPIVALLMPVVHDWARRNNFAPSKFLIPLSFATVLGGVCSLIGTSTNIVVAGLMAESGFEQPHIFEISKIGVPCAIAGIIYLIVFGPKLLPDRTAAANLFSSAREFTTEMVVEAGGPLDGKTIEGAGLRQLKGAFLVEINRAGHVLSVVGPKEILRGGDQLVFVGVVDAMVELQRIVGLRPADEQLFSLEAPRPERILVEAVVSNSCPLLGKTIRDSRFRSYYDAVVIAVSREGARIDAKIGDIVLQTGDTLLLETHPAFVEHRRNSRDFYLVSHVDELSPPRYERRWLAISILAGMCLAAALEITTMFIAACAAAALMIVTKTCSGESARKAVDGRLLLAIGASFGIGKGVEVSGAAALIGQTIIGLANNNPYLALAAIYLIALIFTEIVTNNAAAALVFPIALATAAQLGVSPMPFFMVIMIAASCAFATPIGYTTNLMVYGPGGYRFTDFTKLGMPLNIICAAIAILLAPLMWPF